MFRILFVLLFTLSYLFSADVAIVKNISGDVFAKKQDQMQKLSVGQKIQEHDVIITKDNSSIGMIFEDGTIISLGKNSILSIDKYLFRPSQDEFLFDVNMKKGLATYESGKLGKLSPESVKFRIPEGVIGIRGTKFYVEVK